MKRNCVSDRISVTTAGHHCSVFFDADQGDGSCGSVVDISSIRGSGSSCCLYFSVPYDEENLACIV